MKKASFLIAASLTAALILSGCATGNTSIASETVESIQTKLVKGKTTKADVKAAYGEPSDQGINEGLEYYGYQMGKVDAKAFIPLVGLVTGNNHITGKYLRVSFNKKGTVESYDMSQSKL